MSLLAQERGLKPTNSSNVLGRYLSLLAQERGLKLSLFHCNLFVEKSLLAQERGLKHFHLYDGIALLSRSSRRSVD